MHQHDGTRTTRKLLSTLVLGVLAMAASTASALTTEVVVFDEESHPGWWAVADSGQNRYTPTFTDDAYSGALVGAWVWRRRESGFTGIGFPMPPGADLKGLNEESNLALDFRIRGKWAPHELKVQLVAHDGAIVEWTLTPQNSPAAPDTQWRHVVLSLPDDLRRAHKFDLGQLKTVLFMAPWGPTRGEVQIDQVRLAKAVVIGDEAAPARATFVPPAKTSAEGTGNNLQEKHIVSQMNHECFRARLLEPEHDPSPDDRSAIVVAAMPPSQATPQARRGGDEQ